MTPSLFRVRITEDCIDNISNPDLSVVNMIFFLCKATAPRQTLFIKKIEIFIALQQPLRGIFVLRRKKIIKRGNLIHHIDNSCDYLDRSASQGDIKGYRVILGYGMKLWK